MNSRLILPLALLAATLPARALTGEELDSIGRRIWQNECGGTREGLTSWNAGENFASLGIGHFIWYPKGARGPFEESFPALAKFLAAQGADVPGWVLAAECPWSSRGEFQAQFQSPRMRELRELLFQTLRAQSQFLAQRMERSQAKMLAAASPGQRDKVRVNFQQMLATGAGTFALIDYVNFKGEGTLSTERYEGEGWGLLQVLAGMQGSGPRAFGESADAVLTQRVKNSPPARSEAKWLPGWRNRVRAYGG